jgi:hypothetical protein
MAINIPKGPIKTALNDASKALIQNLGEDITYNFEDGTPAITIRAVRQKISEEEVVGTYRQGDCRFTIYAQDLPKPPEKFDSILAADGRTYVLFDTIAVDKGIDSAPLVFRPIGRGA